MPVWWNWQTRRTQNPVVAIPCGFDPHYRHQIKKDTYGCPFLFGARHLQRPMRGNPALPYSFRFCKSSTVSTRNRPQTQSVLVTSDHRLQRFFYQKTHRASPDAACCCWQKNSSPPFSSPCRNPKHPRLKPGCFPEKVKYVNCV